MTRGAPQFDKSETTPTGISANDVAGIAGDDEGEKPQTSLRASAESPGKGKDPPGPQGSEFEESNLHVETTINGDETGSSKEVPGEGNEQVTNETWERGTSHKLAEGNKGEGESDWENQNLQAKFLIGKRDTMTSTEGNKLQLDDKIDNGKRGANDKLDGRHTKDAERVVGKTQNTPEEVDNEPGRGIIRETKSGNGKISENTRETREGKDADHHSDVINTSDNECVSRNEKPENVQAHKLLMGGEDESRSSETVKAKGQDGISDETGKGGDCHPTTDDTHGKSETLVQVREQEHARDTESAIAGNQVDDDKIETEKEGANDQSVKSEIGNSESGKRHQTLNGDLGTESSESADNKRQEGDTSEPGKGEACEWPSSKKKAATIEKQLARGSEIIKNDKVMKEGKAKKETTKRNDVLSTDGQVTAERVYRERSDIGSVVQVRITKRQTRLVEPRARAEAVGPLAARKRTSTDPICKQKRTKKPSQQPVLPATVPGTRPSAVDLVSGAATSIHLEAEALRQSQEYRLQMSARNLLMHSKLHSYLNEIGMQQLPPAYYFHHYPPLDPAAYLPPDILHPLQYRHLHHPRPYAAVPYATGLPIPLHARPFEAVTRLALAEGRPLGSQMHSAPMFGPSPILGVAEAELLRVVPTVQGADLSGRALELGPSMHSHLHAFDPVRPVQAQQAEAIGARAAFLNNVAALGISPPSVAYRQEIPPSMAEAVAAVASRASKKQVQELPEVDQSTMDKATLDRVRRERRNSQARNREARRRLQLEQIEAKPSNQRTEEEQRLWQEFDKRRQKKNAGARNRAVEKKKEVERILSLPAEARTEEDIQFLELCMGQKKRKVAGDRLRRVRMQQLGFAVNEKVPGITARGPLPPEYQRALEAKQAKEFSKDDYPG